MPRPPKKLRLRVPEGLTDERIEYLIHGENLFLPVQGMLPPFASEAEERKVWKEHRAAVLDRMSENRSRTNYLPGTRPWAFWKFDHGCEPPKREAAELDRLGELGPDERAAVILMAREQLEKMHGRPLHDDGIDADLLRVWPWHLQIFDYDQNTRKLRVADWVERRGEMTEGDWDEVATDPVTAYSFVGLYDGHNFEERT